MIEGIFLDIPAADLRAHFTERADYHRGRVAFYEMKAKALGEAVLDGGDGEEDASFSSNYTAGQDPVAQLKSKGESHRRRSAIYAFMARFLIEETYRLSEIDLQRLEFIDRFW